MKMIGTQRFSHFQLIDGLTKLYGRMDPRKLYIETVSSRGQ